MYKLNNKYSLELCSNDEAGAMNGQSFEPKNDWVIFKDEGERFSESSRYIFTTLYAKEKGKYFACGNAKAAIKQVLVDLLENKRLSEIYFKVIENV